MNFLTRSASATEIILQHIIFQSKDEDEDIEMLIAALDKEDENESGER